MQEYNGARLQSWIAYMVPKDWLARGDHAICLQLLKKFTQAKLEWVVAMLAGVVAIDSLSCEREVFRLYLKRSAPLHL